MKKHILFTLLIALALQPTLLLRAADAPKKLLVVTTTTVFRHASIPTLEKMLTQLASDSGEFTVDFVRQPPGKPANLRGNATDEQKAAFKTAEEAWEASLKTALQKLSPENLKNYDGVVFASTTGNLPIPDKQGFLDWIKAGHAFIGIHAASDTFHGWPGYIEMLGGEFDHHGAQLSVEYENDDPQNPATAHLDKTWPVALEEVYQFKNYNPTNVHELLTLDLKPEKPYSPGHFAAAWCKNYGDGKVFYTAIGHRDDIIDASPDMKDRKNSVAVAKAYQQHILGGIEWALGLKK
ncbi:MAG TPA: ThuA domain-containing protein [Verrucomicrobiae bacterium]